MPEYIDTPTAIFAYWVFNSLVQALPSPKDGGNPYYLFAFRFIHSLAGNWGLVTKESKHVEPNEPKE